MSKEGKSAVYSGWKTAAVKSNPGPFLVVGEFFIGGKGAGGEVGGVLLKDFG